MKISCIAIDDEPLALDKITDYIQQVPFLALQGSFDNALEALAFLQANKIDLLFLDIQMPQLKGTQLLQILKNPPLVILTTAYSEYALEGYDLDVIDYLLKPIAFDRFLQAVNKVLERSASPVIMQRSIEAPQEIQDYIFVKVETRLQKVMLNDILYIEGLKDYLSIYTVKERILTLQSFKEILEKLPGSFIRIHKSYAVYIHKIDTVEKNRVRIGDKYLPIGDTYKKSFLMEITKSGKI